MLSIVDGVCRSRNLDRWVRCAFVPIQIAQSDLIFNNAIEYVRGMLLSQSKVHSVFRALLFIGCRAL